MPILPDLLPDMPEPRNGSTPDPAPSTPVPRTRDDVLDFLRRRIDELWQQQIQQDYGAIEQRVLAASLQQGDSDADAQRLAITPLSNRYIYRGTSTGRMEVRNPMQLNPRTTTNPWPFETRANLQHTHEDFIMANHNDTFVINRIEHTELEVHIDHLLAHYSEGTAEGDDIKACFEVVGTLSMRDEETASKFQERCVFLAACYASRSFPPAREELKRHVISMLASATRDVLGAYGVYALSANGNGYAVLDTGRAAVFRALEAAVSRRFETEPAADPSSLRFYRDAPPRIWVDADKLDSFVHDKQAHAEELRRETALVGAMAVDENIKQLMRMYLTRAGNNYAHALRYYHTVSLFNVFRNHADNYTTLLFYSYKVKDKDKEVRGLQYSTGDNDFITGFGGY